MSDPKSLTEQSRDLEKQLNDVLAAMLADIKPALMRSAQEVAGTMRTLAEASRDTGALIDSIAITGPGETTPAYAAGGGKRTAGQNEALVTVGNEHMRHGHFVEFGTSKMEAQPFMRPAIRINLPRYKRRMTRAMNAAAKKAARQ
jgi:HK97 gp10 family phage protein